MRFTAAILRVVLALVVVASGLAVRAADAANEYQIKAAFVYNFTKFVEWQPERFTDANAPIVIGVIGNEAFSAALRNAVHGRRAGGREIEVTSLSGLTMSSTLHVVFVGAGREAAFDVAESGGILTIGETDRFTALGGMITFISDADKVRFMVNLEKVESAQMKLSAQLLKLATSVRRKERKSP